MILLVVGVFEMELMYLNIFLCGASAVQVGSQLKMEGLNCFNRLTNELQQIMKQKGYQKLEDFKGKLKYI